ncbi:restriction endonuclease subunit S [Yokenella regensburgei]|uniref:restriction endonuclease subunit S n=1 Tax=Yokenella regensburgei TaxID=158877 RepID=UPI003ED8F2A2
MVPKIRFKSSSASLGKHKIEDILTRFVSPVSVSKIEKYREIGIRSHGRGLFHKEEVSGVELGNKRVFWIKKDAVIFNIVFAWEQAVAITSSKDEGCIASHRFPMYLPKDNKCNTDYIRRYFLTKKGKYLLELASPGGAGRNKTLGQKNFDELVVIIPDVTEQTKIADFLSSVDEKIALLKKHYDLLCQYKKGMMQKIFSQELRFKDENGETFPEWIQTSLGTISKVYDGTHQTPNYVEFGVPFYSVEHVTADNFDDTKYISDDVFEQESKRVSIQQGDILMTRIGDIGTVKHINWIPRASFYVSLSLIKVRESFDSKMISYCMQSDFFQKDLHEKTIHVAFPKKINLGEISNCKIKMPASKKEQTKIVILLSAIDDKIAVKKAELDKLKTWKQGLLQQMFV